jgi:hypothetical protein
MSGINRLAVAEEQASGSKSMDSLKARIKNEESVESAYPVKAKPKAK